MEGKAALLLRRSTLASQPASPSYAHFSLISIGQSTGRQPSSDCLTKPGGDLSRSVGTMGRSHIFPRESCRSSSSAAAAAAAAAVAATSMPLAFLLSVLLVLLISLVLRLRSEQTVPSVRPCIVIEFQIRAAYLQTKSGEGRNPWGDEVLASSHQAFRGIPSERFGAAKGTETAECVEPVPIAPPTTGCSMMIGRLPIIE